MDDMISRRAALERFDYIRPRDPMTSDYTHGIDVGIALCKVAIREQPPAQLSTNLAEVGMDCISRQAAIDVINHELRCGAVIDQCGLETAHDLIEELPSAEPQIIRCKECINRHLGHGFCPMVHVSIDGQYELYELNQDNDFCSFAERRGVTK